jgi:uncharacterized protein YbcV (DUF1398 family)
LITKKDIEQMREAGNACYYLEETEAELTHYIYFKTLEALKKYVKENYNAGLQSKENALKKVTGVRIWRR